MKNQTPAVAASSVPPARGVTQSGAPKNKKDSAPLSAAGAPQAATVVAKAKSRLSFKEQRELAELPERIAALEQEVASIAALQADPAAYRSGAQEAKKIAQRSQQVERQLSEALARWEELELRNGA
jgi:ATP-binding cassette subfamily F protein uup